MFPTTFPSGEGSDLAGVVETLGDGVTAVAAGDEVIGFVENRSSHAEYVLVEAANLTPRPAGLPWEVAGSLFVMGTTAVAAVRAVSVHAGDTVVVSGAAGGVGSLAVQLARRAGARVIGVAGPADLDWVRSLGADAVEYGDGVVDRLRALAPRIDAVVDTSGHGYVAMAVDDLGVDPQRVDTIIDFPAIGRYGVKGDGNAAATDIAVVAALAALAAAGGLEIPIAATFPLDEVVEAFRFLEAKRGRGKVVLVP
jgi:NADPH:quinone reductase-like Zn-dependent oxidoreductase